MVRFDKWPDLKKVKIPTTNSYTTCTLIRTIILAYTVKIGANNYKLSIDFYRTNPIQHITAWPYFSLAMWGNNISKAQIYSFLVQFSLYGMDCPLPILVCPQKQEPASGKVLLPIFLTKKI